MRDKLFKAILSNDFSEYKYPEIHIILMDNGYISLRPDMVVHKEFTYNKIKYTPSIKP